MSNSNYHTQDYSTAQAVAESITVDYPLAEFGDFATIVWRRRYRQLADAWTPLVPDSTFSHDAETTADSRLAGQTFYLDSETPPQQLPGGVYEWERVFAQKSRKTGRVVEGTINVIYPFEDLGRYDIKVVYRDHVQSRMEHTPLPFDSAFVWDAEAKADKRLDGLSELFSAGRVGDPVRVGAYKRWTEIFVSIPTAVERPLGTVDVQFPGRWEDGLTPTTVLRPSFYERVNTVEVLDFFHAPAADDYNDIPITGKIIPSALPSGVESNNLNDSTATTWAAYAALIGTNQYTYVVEPSSVTRWYGNVFVRSTKKAQAL